MFCRKALLQVWPSLKHNDAVLNPSRSKFLFGFSALVRSTISIAWMYPASKSLLIGNSLQKSGELLPFAF